MSRNLFDPSQYGFVPGSAVFDFPPTARKLVNESSSRIRGCSHYVQFWERVLDANERKDLGGNVDECASLYPNCIDLLCKMRDCWNRERAVAEIARTLGFLTQQDYQWICQLADNERAVSTMTPNWNRETGRLEFNGKLCRMISVRVAKKLSQYWSNFKRKVGHDQLNTNSCLTTHRKSTKSAEIS